MHRDYGLELNIEIISRPVRILQHLGCHYRGLILSSVSSVNREGKLVKRFRVELKRTEFAIVVVHNVVLAV